MTEEARKRTGSAKDTAQGAKEYAQQTVDAGSDYIKDTQQQGESAWQKVKDRVTETVDKVICYYHFPPATSAGSIPQGHNEQCLAEMLEARCILHRSDHPYALQIAGVVRR